MSAQIKDEHRRTTMLAVDSPGRVTAEQLDYDEFGVGLTGHRRYGAIALALGSWMALRTATASEKAAVMTEAPSVQGMTLCDLPLGTSKTGFPLRSASELEIIQFEGKAESVAILRLDKRLPERCAGRVVAELRLPPHGSEEFAYFPCSYSPPKGRKVTRVVGLGSNDNGRLVSFRPRLAWRVDVQSSRFVPVETSRVVCEGWKGVD